MRRVNPVEILSSRYGLDYRIEDLELNEDSIMRYSQESGVLPTIGCEVEIKWSALFPDVANKFFGQANQYGLFERNYDDLSKREQVELNEVSQELDHITLPRFNETLLAGIPKGNDAYWEFANRPAYAHQTIATEVSLLKDIGLVPYDSDHSLHITLGNLSSRGGGVNLILTSLELMYANPDRIRLATLPNRYGGKSAWARRGKDGLRSRHPNDLELGSNIACELRTLSINDNVNHADIFRSAQLLGSLLLMQREGHVAGQDWWRFRELSRRAIESAQLEVKSWGLPHLASNQDKWLRWADFIAMRDDRSSQQLEIIEEIREIENSIEQVIG